MHTVQILVEDRGNQEVISGFLKDGYEILTSQEVQQADAYLVEDSVYPNYRDALERMVHSERPVFCPVVMIRGVNSKSPLTQQETVGENNNTLVVDIIEAPVREPVLNRRLALLLRRREQSQKLQQKMEQVERQRDALSVLNQMVRHDIRNDMQLVLGYAQQVSDYVANEGEDALETVISSTEAAIELTTKARELTDLLLEEDSEIESIRINEVVEKEVQTARNSNPNVSIEYQTPGTDLTVTGDQMLSSVVRNLVTNAILHNDAESPKVSVSVSEASDSVFLSVADNGPGIPDESKEVIFEKGAMGNESSGTGIGLFLVAEIVDRYGGEVHVEDSKFDGAEFIVELPIAS